MPQANPNAFPRQTPLPLAKAAGIAWRSLRARAGRNLLTVITIALAIAFVTNIWASSICEPIIQAAQAKAQGLTEFAPSARPSRQGLLLILSLLVCMVGITNAMLMSVMERYREIGTMKCLGALDQSILTLYLLESVFLGALGTLLGIAAGLLITVLLFIKNYGAIGWTAFPLERLPAMLVITLLLGLTITAGAAVYPAWKAARMEPISAMRTEV